ncbi:MAG: GAF domain-containing protein [Anaerolineales bacterium]|nr:GAF domain-containing protein [Anaerolineales bacterium]
MPEATVIGTKTLVRIMLAIQAVENGRYNPEMLAGMSSANGEMGQLAIMLDRMARSVSVRDNQLLLLRRIIPVGVALSAEKDFNRLLETLVVEAQFVTNADAGTLYLLEDDELKFVIIRNTSLNLKMGGTSQTPISFSPIKLHHADGSANRSNIASYSALTGEQVTIADAYTAEGFDFSGTKAVDQTTKYRSKSFLTSPLKNSDGKVIGILQLINAKHPETGEVIPFLEDDALDALVLLANAALDGYIREASLRQEIAQLKIEIDGKKRENQVREITETAYFRELKQKATDLRNRQG